MIYKLWNTMAVFTLVLLSCNGGEKKTTTVDVSTQGSTAAVPVVVSPVSQLQQKAAQNAATLSGSVEPMETVDVGFNVAGRVAQVYVQEGQSVGKGQLLATQDAASYQYGLQAANATLAQAQDAYDRATILQERGSIAPVDYQKAVTSLQQAKAAQSQAAKNVQDARLHSPVSGVVAKRSIQPGEQAGPGIPQFSLVKVNPIKIVANVPEAEVGRYKKGQRLQVQVPALDLTTTGTLSLIGIQADPTTRAFRIEVSVPNPGTKIRPGMIANVVATADTVTTSNRITLPPDVVQHDPDGRSFVYVVDPQQKKAQKRTIGVGALVNNNVEVVSGLTGSEIVVTGGQQKLHDGSLVSFQNPAP